MKISAFYSTNTPFEKALAFEQAGQLEQAIEYYQTYLKLEPNHFAAMVNLAEIFIKCDQTQQALILYEKIVAQYPLEPLFSCKLGHLYLAMQRNQEAIAVLTRVLGPSQYRVSILSGIATAYEKEGQVYTAIAYLNWCVLSEPQDWISWFNLSNVYYKNKLYQDAYHSLQHVMKLKPKEVNVLKLMISVLIKLEQYEIALQVCQNQLQGLLPTVEIEYRKGLIYYEAGKLEQAKVLFEMVIAKDSQHAKAYYHLGNVLSDSKNYEQAINCYQQVLQYDSKIVDAYFNKGLCHLALDQWDQGWPLYEMRWQIERYKSDWLQSDWPQLESLEENCKSLLVWSEQGIGDEIMFVQLLPELNKNNRKVTVMCNSRVLPLFKRSFPKMKFIPRTTALLKNNNDAFDHHIPMGSLPNLIGMNSLGQKKFYLLPDDEEKQKFRRSRGNGIHIGLSWKGGIGSQAALRSIPLNSFLPLLEIPNLYFTSVQYGECLKEIHDFNAEQEKSLLHYNPEIDPIGQLDRFAAQLCCCDLIVSVDNSTVHLAGALGVPCWALLPHKHEWRWPASGTQSLWYRSVKLYRADALSWESCIEQIRKDIKNLSD